MPARMNRIQRMYLKRIFFLSRLFTFRIGHPRGKKSTTGQGKNQQVPDSVPDSGNMLPERLEGTDKGFWNRYGLFLAVDEGGYAGLGQGDHLIAPLQPVIYAETSVCQVIKLQVYVYAVAYEDLAQVVGHQVDDDYPHAFRPQAELAPAQSAEEAVTCLVDHAYQLDVSQVVGDVDVRYPDIQGCVEFIGWQLGQFDTRHGSAPLGNGMGMNRFRV